MRESKMMGGGGGENECMHMSSVYIPHQVSFKNITCTLPPS